MSMEYRRLGRTELQVSVVGFGTNELRLLTRTQAIDTLLRSFDLGVNLVHTSPDYEGAEDLIAEAMARTSRPVIVASQGYDVHYNRHGRVNHFEQLFEATCARLKTERLDLYGIAAVDDREAFQENVWGPQGMVEFLLRMKEQGRLGGAFCTNHGDPSHMRKLVESGVFDAMMISCNPLGFHLLSLNPPPGRHFENVVANGTEIVALCKEHDVGVLAMMPLAGGLLLDSRAFPPRRREPEARRGLSATDVLRAILQDKGIASVLPGTGSVEEAEENATAGHAPGAIDDAAKIALRERVETIQSSLCSRCGACELLCSRQLPISWLFRAGEMAMQPAEAFETWSDVEYFRLHPDLQAACATCADVSCVCPQGIAIPDMLIATHTHMTDLMRAGLVAPPLQHPSAYRGSVDFGARIVSEDIPDVLPRGVITVCRLHLENLGVRGWFPAGLWENGGVLLRVFINDAKYIDAWFRQEVHMGGRGHVVFELMPPADSDHFHLRLKLLSEHEGFADESGFEVFSRDIRVTEAGVPIGESPLDAWRGRQGDRRDGDRQTLIGAADVVPAYAVQWVEHNLPECWGPGDPLYVHLRVANLGARAWPAQNAENRFVNLVVRANGAIIAMPALPHDVGPRGGEALISFLLHLPQGQGHWELSFNFVEQNVAWFEHNDVRPLVVTVKPSDTLLSVSDRDSAVLRRYNPSFYSPAQGVSRSRTGLPYPSIIAQANGARIRDPDGHEWIDFVMGWGSSLLGHAHPAITEAIASVMGCGAILSLPHRLEVEATALLAEAMPCAQTVLFGKNGSDACTAAIRTARVTTGRDIIMFSGYHGWQESFGAAGEPSLSTPDQMAAVRFATNDIDSFRALADRYRGRVAAVMVEPAAQVEGVDGPVRDCDPAFLAEVADMTRRQGSVLIFDEIMTGFRHPRGSVQKATGVIPDLTCVGKALTSGMPLSALIGRRDILEPALPRLFYHPTFKGDVYAFAAAAAALRVYRDQDVPGSVAVFGARLMQQINQISLDLGIDGLMVGLPYRMVYRINEPNDLRRAQMRTLLHQLLLQNGILTFRGFMLPSLAHGEYEMDRTLAAYRTALTEVRDRAHSDRLVSSLEIPLLF